MVSITGTTTGIVTGDPPNVATGDLDPSSPFTINSEAWSISSPPAHGTASIDPNTGEWTYTVDPAFFDSLDFGQTVQDTFTVRLDAVVQTFLGPFAASDTVTITIDIQGVCFTAGTLIETGSGPQLIEHLEVGDLVRTADHGLQPIRWIEAQEMTTNRLKDNPSLRPVRISAGSLGPDIPRRDLVVSQQHRMLLRGPKVELLFGTNEVLVAAKHLCSWPGISIVTSHQPVEYMHILMDRHEILFAEDAQAESLYLGEEALHAMSSEGLQELAEIFSGVEQFSGRIFGPTARMILREREAIALA